MATYNELSLKALTAAFDGNQTAREWLKAHSCLHLLAVYDVIVRKNPKALEWLRQSRDQELYLFVLAVQEERKEAIRTLLELNCKPMAAAANAVLGDRKAWKWMEEHKLEAHYDFAEAVQKFYNAEADSSISGY